MLRELKQLLILSGLFLTAGCASTSIRAYSGAARAPAEVAIVHGGMSPGLFVTEECGISSVDGNVLPGSQVQLFWTTEILPGAHDIRVEMQKSNSSTNATSRCFADLEDCRLNGGQEYEIHFDKADPPFNVKASIANSASKQPICWTRISCH